MKNIFITGATGFLGSYLLKRILDDNDTFVNILARSKKSVPAKERIEKVLEYFYGKDAYDDILKRIRIIDGAIDRTFFGMDPETKKLLISEVDEIYHSAAIAEFRVPLEVIRKTNVEGTRNVLEFAMECNRKGRLRKLNHVSTTYLAGDRKGVFYENELDVGQKFNNTYEQSKFEAELLVREYMKKGLNVTIFRPSILTGDSITGKTSNFKMLYQPLRFFAAELFDAIPANRAALENLIAVDSAAEAIHVIAKDLASGGNTYHVANPEIVTAGHFVDVASDFFGFKKPEFIPVEKFDQKALSDVQRLLLDPFVPYFNYTLSFDVSNLNSMLKKKRIDISQISDAFLSNIFKFCADSGFIKPKRRYAVAG